MKWPAKAAGGEQRAIGCGVAAALLVVAILLIWLWFF